MDDTSRPAPPTPYDAVSAFREERRGRRVDPTVIRIGTFGGAHLGIPHDPGIDVGLRADLLERVLDGLDVAEALVWITRGGALAPGDADFGWYAAARQAFERHGSALTAFYVITRDGFLNLVNDVTVRMDRSA